MSRFNFKNPFKNAPSQTDERLQSIVFKGGTYAFLITVLLSFAVAFLFILRLENRIDFSDEAFALLLLLPWLAGSGYFTIYLLKNGVFKAQREEVNRKPYAQRFKWFFLIGGFLWMLIFLPTCQYFVFKTPWQETIRPSFFAALFYIFFTWFFQYRKVKNTEE